MWKKKTQISNQTICPKKKKFAKPTWKKTPSQSIGRNQEQTTKSRIDDPPTPTTKHIPKPREKHPISINKRKTNRKQPNPPSTHQPKSEEIKNPNTKPAENLTSSQPTR